VKDAYDSQRGVLYEVDLDADEAITGPFDTWLRDHIADLLALPGFRSAEILENTSPQAGRIRRTIQYRLNDQLALDNYMRVHAPRMREQGIALFGDRFTSERRVLAHREEFISGKVSTENCLNCGEVLTGQHCSHCGQRASVRVISLWSMFKDVLGDMVDWDSRVWRTLRPLALKPGWLTQQFLIGRRASFTPPFRMYLILSVVFFLVASFDDPGKDLEVRSDAEGTGLVINGKGDARKPEDAAQSAKPAEGATPPSKPAAGETSSSAKPSGHSSSEKPDMTPGAPKELDNPTKQLIDEVVKRSPANERAQVRADLEREMLALPADQRARVGRLMEDPCSKENLKFGVGALHNYEGRLRQACTKIMADKVSFGRAIWDNVPKMMFIFLPLIAAVMSVLYIGSKRYYAEHLVFFVHYHAFFFLAGIAVAISETIGDPNGGLVQRAFDQFADILEFVLLFYVPIYLYRAMRRVYGQGRFWTFTKFAVLNIAYIICIVLTGVGLLFYTALTL
jgi:Protein of unknown function (DUF3667)/Domain of unknown function (DUF4286)